MKGYMKAALLVLGSAVLLAADARIAWGLATRTASRAGSAPVYSEALRDPVASFRLEREQLRARQEAQLNDIIYSQASDGETVAQAQRMLLDSLANAQAEMTIEEILKSRGFTDALVSVSANSANVILRGEGVTQRETAVILDLVMRETGLTGGNVKIIPVK